MIHSSPDPSDDNVLSEDETLSLDLKARRHQLVLDETIDRVRDTFVKRQEDYLNAAKGGANEGDLISPLHWLKTQTMAYLAILTEAHCRTSRALLAAGEEEDAAHTWAVDEGRLMAALETIAGVDLP